MEIGDDQPVRRDDEARAMSTLAANALDAADGRTDAVDRVGDRHRIGVEQRLVRLEFGGGEGHGWAPCFQA
ncbi:hypothetical protein ACVINZ_002334 [Mesorhizobium jarvisii]